MREKMVSLGNRTHKLMSVRVAPDWNLSNSELPRCGSIALLELNVCCKTAKNDVVFRKGYVSDGGRMKKRCKKDGNWTGRDGGCQLTTCHAIDQLPPEVKVEPPECAQVSNFSILQVLGLVRAVMRS